MKQVFYIIALLLAFFFSDSDSNNAYGQNMAQEHYNPWKGAEKTGEYYMERCKKCNIWITGYWRNRQTLWGGCTDANPKLLLNDT